MRFVRIPPGVARIGSPRSEEGRQPDETVRHETIPTAYYLAVTEVTREQFAAIMGRAPWAVADQREAEANSVMPADRITWDEAVEFCRRLSDREGRTYRLPGEAEWEHACRAGTQQAVSGTGRLDDMGWYSANSAGRLRLVARCFPNHWGLYDLHGNVAEWCGDLDPSAVVVEPNPSLQMAPVFRVARGGNVTSRADRCRSASRMRLEPTLRHASVGFRIVLDTSGEVP